MRVRLILSTALIAVMGLALTAPALTARVAAATRATYIYDPPTSVAATPSVSEGTSTTPVANARITTLAAKPQPTGARRSPTSLISLRTAAEGGIEDAASVVAKVHGNSASSPATAYLYRLTDAETGAYLKTGISKNPFSRYSSAFMRDKEMEILTSGGRREMLNLERFIVERNPGPLNREPWAGRYADDVPGGGH